MAVEEPDVLKNVLMSNSFLHLVSELMEGCSSEMAAFSQNMLTVSVLLSVFFLPGVQTGCKNKDPVLIITAPKEMEALNGSCLLIPCSFREKPEKPGEKFDNKREIFGVWIKSDSAFGNNPNNVIYNSSRSQNSYAVNISGNLREKNCTSVFFNVNSSQANRYFFRIENWLFRGTASCDPVNITVRDSAWSPRIEISGDVKEKNSVTVTCSALTPCPYSPPELTLNLQPNPHRQMERNTDGTFTTTIQQKITLSDSNDVSNITCSARYPVNGGKHKTANTEVTLSVSYAPKNTSACNWVELNCSSRASPPISCTTWSKNSTYKAMIVAEGDVRLTVYEGEVDRRNVSDNLLIPLITVTVVVVLIFLVVWFLKSRRTAVQHNQTEAPEEPGVLASSDTKMPSLKGVLQTPSNERQEELHYGDVNFIKKPSCVSESTSGDQQETLYSQVKVSEPKNRSADSSDPLYSTVQKPG
ncbi:myeloid cell surface antigen CD33-like isoform X2 [Poecilia formosa]|uniref:myeloid cell surface antigen CD33-like isoform X2 n=1 Tax=Poecilia formosa TaxID=48698 RepID=UPI0007B93D17|nr:PREDICTED: myeloid cell surface antigen CD33-like isoform X2 [Poecilia formosa]